MKTCICIPSVMKMRVRYELFKLCKSKALIVFFVLCISVYCVICVSAGPDLSEYPFDTRLYRMYAEKYSGEFSQSTLDKMNSELEQLSGQAQVSLENKALSAEEYISEDNKRAIAQQKANALEAVKQRYEQLKDGARLVYDLELNAYHTGWLRKLGMLLCLALITVITVKLSLDDHKCGMEQILFTTACGKKKLLCAKLTTAAALALMTAVIFVCADAVIIASRRDPGDLSAPVQSFRSFENSSFIISMRIWLYISFGVRVLLFTVYSLMLAAFARLTESDIGAVCIALTVTICPFVFLSSFCLI